MFEKSGDINDFIIYTVSDNNIMAIVSNLKYLFQYRYRYQYYLQTTQLSDYLLVMRIKFTG